ncbi:MAG TPA: DUF481 domain-containing protein, partial [Opitutaceae bacterium]|nr:DUF481 domain-containing protein [Opitutaceae bacterium]
MAHRFLRAAAVAAALLLFLSALPRARATQLVLANGDRLTGKVVRQEKGLIYFHSDVLGDIIAPANQVTIVETPKTATPTESMVGLPPMPNKGGAAPAPAPAGTASAAAGPPASPVASAASPATPGAPAATPAASVAGQPPAGPAAPLPGPHHKVIVSSPLPAEPGAARAASWWWPWWVARPFLVLEPVVTHWIGKIEFGYDNNLTTTRAVTTTTRIEADRIVGPDNFQFKGDYLYGRSDLTATTDQDELDFRWRHNLDSRLFTEATTTYSQDKIRLINDSLEQEGSFGYKVYSDQRQTVDFGVGLIGQYL